MLLVPLQASWLKTAEANGWLAEESGTDYHWLSPGEQMHLDP